MTAAVVAGVTLLGGGFFNLDFLPAQAAPADTTEAGLEPGLYAHTVIFQDGDATTAVQVGDNQLVAAPVMPSHDGEVFDGWWDDAADPAVQFDIANTHITSDITLTAHFKQASYLVNFMADTTGDGDYAVLASAAVPAGESLDGAGVTADFVDFPDGLVPAGTFFDDKWVTSDNETVAWGAVVTGDMTLYPVFGDGSYVWFRSGGTAVSPQVVLAGEAATEPDSPTRTGYTFDGWYADAACAGSDTDGSVCNSSPYVFSTSVSSTITLYGRWQAETVDYTVVYWEEKPNIAGDPGTDFANYDYLMSLPGSALAGTTLTADDTAYALADQDLTDAETANVAVKYSQFAHSTQVTVAGDGTSLVNVFYQRKIYTVNFDLNDDDTYIQHDGETYIYPEQYQVQAKFEQDIRTIWPQPNEEYRTGYVFYQWRYTTVTGDKVRASSYNYFEEEFCAYSEEYEAGGPITVVATWMPNTTTTPTWRLPYVEATNDEMVTINELLASGETIPNWNSSDGEVLDGVHFRPYVYLPETGKYYVLDDENIIAGNFPNSNNNCRYLTFNGWTIAGPFGAAWTYILGDVPAPTYFAGSSDSLWYGYMLYDRVPTPLTFDAAGGTAPTLSAAQDALRYGDTVGAVADPTPPNDGQSYVFDGWFIDPNYQVAFDPAMTMPVGGLILFAKWLADPVTVQFYDSTGASDPLSGLTEQVSAGSLAVDPGPLATRAGGSAFQGWYYRDPVSGRLMPYEWNQPVEENLDLYARWQSSALSPVGVEYRGNGNTAGDPPVDAGFYPYLPGSMVRLADGQSLLRNGGQFIGWTIDDDPQMYYPGDLVEIPAGGLELTAQYSVAGPAPVQATFVDTGADTPDVVWDSVFDATAVWPDNTDIGFARAGYSFLGWSTDPAATTADPAYERLNQQTGLEESVTLYGVWRLIPLPSIHLTKTGTVPDPKHPQAGDVLTWTFEVANDGNVDLTNVTIDDPQLPSITCTLDDKAFTLGAESTDVLPVGATAKCTATATVLQSDIDNTGAVNTASVSGKDPDGTLVGFGPVTATTPLAQNPDVTIQKDAYTADANNNGKADVGEQITFTITLENLGNVTINQLKVDDSMKDLALTCVNQTTNKTVENGSISLPPSQTVVCVTSPYTITAEDAANGSVVNVATIDGQVGNPPPPALRLPGDSGQPGSIGGGDGSQVTVQIAPQQQAPTGGWLATGSWLWLGGIAPVLAGACLLLWRRRRQAGEAV